MPFLRSLCWFACQALFLLHVSPYSVVLFLLSSSLFLASCCGCSLCPSPSPCAPGTGGDEGAAQPRRHTHTRQHTPRSTTRTQEHGDNTRVCRYSDLADSPLVSPSPPSVHSASDGSSNSDVTRPSTRVDTEAHVHCRGLHDHSHPCEYECFLQCCSLFLFLVCRFFG